MRGPGASRTLPILALLLLLAMSLRAQQSDDAFDRIKRATVFIYQAEDRAGDLIVKCVSSGTLISADGLIVTNAHSALQSRRCDGDTLIASLNVELDEPPVPKYRAEIFSADAGLDIAILRIARELDGRLIAPGDLPILPFADIGDSGGVALDDNLAFAGYPDLGNEPVAIVRGTAAAFIAEPAGGSRAWLKTLTRIPGAMSGGGAYNSAGQLVGVPTSAPVAGEGENCRVIDDSNRDGRVDGADVCVPVGEAISAIRPIQLAQSLIRGARRSLQVEQSSGAGELAPPLHPPRISRPLFSPAIVDRMPSTVVGSLPANTNSLYFFFDYDNMTPETIYELRVSRDGRPEQSFSLPPVRWSGQERGLWHIGSRGLAWANGAYEFTLLVDGAAAASQRIVIGGEPRGAGQFSDIVFGILTGDGMLAGNGSILPVGAIASARFLFANMADGVDWAAIWYFSGAEFARAQDRWSDGAQGSKVISVQPQGGLLPGFYRLELYVAGALSATSDFVVAGEQRGPLPDIFSNVRYSVAGDPVSARRAQAASSFPGGVAALYALFDWRRIAAGTPWTLRWLVDDQVFYQTAAPWQSLESGSDFTLALANPPDGNYKLQLLVNGLQLVEAEAIVGIGQLPIDRLAQYEGTVLSGRVLDAATGRGVPSVAIVLISAEFTAEEFEWRGDQVYALATSDRNGDFQFALPLAYDTPYSVVIETDGFIPLAADGFQFGADQPFADITIELARG